MVESKGNAKDGQHCEECGRVLVTVAALARAIHSGCALTGENHTLETCPSKANFLLDAKTIQGNLQRQAGGPADV